MDLSKHSDFEGGAPPVGGVSAVAWGPASTDPRLEADENSLADASRNAFPVVAAQKNRRDHLGLAAGAAVALVLGALTFVSMNNRRDNAPEPASANQTKPQQIVSQPASNAPPAVLTAQQPVAGVQPMTEHQMQALAHPMPAGSVTVATSTAAGRRAAPAMVFDGSNPASASGPAPAKGPDANGAPALLAGGTNIQGLSISDSAAARSTRLEDPANTVVQGTLIPAVLETALNSDLPGFARAVVSQDVRSFDDSRILIPRSSRLIGEYKSGLSAGQRRVFLVWTRLVRPDGVSVALSSPSVGFSGEAGIGGKVNSHFVERFGSAILTSVLGGASTALSGGATVVVAGGQSAASLAGQGGQRPPTIRVRQGEPIKVFTSRDLIFQMGAGASE